VPPSGPDRAVGETGRVAWVSLASPATSLVSGQVRPSRDELLVRYAHLVKYVVGRLGVSVRSVFDREDAIQVGTIGLLNAIDAYDPTSASSFESYAITRIRGAVLDAVRSLDAVGRAGREAGRAIQEAIRELTGQLGRTPEETEVADRLGVSLTRYRAKLQAASMVTMSFNDVRPREEDDGGGLDDVTADPFAIDPEDAAVRTDLVATLADEIRQLSERQQLILSLYYRDELTFREIGEILGVTESRICQIHTEAVLALRGRLVEPDVARRLNSRRNRR
jgi:RNA polymerase sigma factor for flagellar operon FliA